MAGPVLDDGGPAGAVDVLVTGRAAGTGSLTSQSAPSPITVTKAAARTGMSARRVRRPRIASTVATWPGARCESAVTTGTAILCLLEVAECPGAKEAARGNAEDVS